MQNTTQSPRTIKAVPTCQKLMLNYNSTETSKPEVGSKFSLLLMVDDETSKLKEYVNPNDGSISYRARFSSQTMEVWSNIRTDYFADIQGLIIAEGDNFFIPVEVTFTATAQPTASAKKPTAKVLSALIGGV